MQNKTFTVAELYNLQLELSFLLKEKIRATLRVDLVDLLEQVGKHLAPVEQIRKDLIGKHLSTDENLPAEKRPGYPEFEKEILEVLAMTREVSYNPIKKDLLSFETDKDYRLIFRLLEKEQVNTPILS